MLNFRGQTLMELVVGLGLITIVVSALAITTTYSLRNSQFSKNQVQATKLAQENLERVRTIKNSNMGVCLPGVSTSNCVSWESIWSRNFGTQAAGCTDCKFILMNNCSVPADTQDPVQDLCLSHSTPRGTRADNFTYQIFLEDEAGSTVLNPQKRVTSRVYWTDTTGEHSSDLVTVFSKI